ncbi:hypothetical protein LAZ67_4003115 [Cordylochernes scorpioides]|uniref:Uncharacterized protein n=1 Tax=Cordylochernes scorpioides TaxID=51811 RepID=A0ABY6KDK5_9ARAC|nr:hypothetical protein LAZ67_4003115 [Cordylochernes scorpioides]
MVTSSYITYSVRCSKYKCQGHRRANCPKLNNEGRLRQQPFLRGQLGSPPPALPKPSTKPATTPPQANLSPPIKKLHQTLNQNLALRVQNPAPKQDISAEPSESQEKERSLSKDPATVKLLAYQQLDEALKYALNSLFESAELERIAKDRIIKALVFTTHLKLITEEQAKTLHTLLSKIITLVDDKTE